MAAASAVDLAPLLRIALLGGLLALGPLAWLWLRQRGADPAARRRGLTLLVLFLTFDLVLFGAFTRLSDSGLGCPDWPGCYGNASPVGARSDIDAAQHAAPFGPVTHAKAWIEMTHRYFATAVGVLITVLAVTSWSRAARAGPVQVSPWWPTATLAWVLAQGAFGALTVTMKLYPAIVTLHLLGGLGLLVLLSLQAGRQDRAPPLAVSPALRRGLWGIAALTLLQVALGGWVSTNYAVLACAGFPLCQGQWWPAMDFAGGFSILRELGSGPGGAPLRFEALVAIQQAHRIVAAVLLLSMAGLAWRLNAMGGGARRWAGAVVAAAACQLGTGMLNVLFDWPLAAALAHTAGAAGWVVGLTRLLVRSQAVPESASAVDGRFGRIGTAS
ncbi:MAG: COX15/CtaA family protein [Burkholderiaceae bacterium]